MPVTPQRAASNRFVLAAAIMGRTIPIHNDDRNAATLGRYLAGRIDEFANSLDEQTRITRERFDCNAAHHWAAGLTDSEALSEIEQYGHVVTGLWSADQDLMDVYLDAQERIARSPTP